MVPKPSYSLLNYFLSFHSDPRVRMIPHEILETDLHMDYNSVVHHEDVDLSRATLPDLDLQRIVSLSTWDYDIDHSRL